MVVQKTSVFPAGRDFVFQKLQQLETLQLIEKDETYTQYMDRVEIHAGWKTVFIWLWANAFYAHRQMKWIRLLKREEA